MGKKITIQRHSKKRIVILSFAAILAVILALILWNFVQTKQDAQRFSRADQIKDGLLDQLIEELAISAQVEESNVCFNSEQGPFDNGRLWCQVSSAAYYNQHLEAPGVVSSFEEVLDRRGLSGIKSPSGNLVFYVSKDLPCTLYVLGDVAATEPGYFLTDNPGAKQTLIVHCSDRAKAKHYQYRSS